MENNILENHICDCRESNQKEGKEIYSCFKCQKPPEKLSREERKGRYLSYVLSKGKGMVAEEVLIEEASDKFDKFDKFDKENPI